MLRGPHSRRKRSGHAADDVRAFRRRRFGTLLASSQIRRNAVGGVTNRWEIQMEMKHVKSSLDRIEQSADRAIAALRQSSGEKAPDDLRRCVKDMHAQARAVRDMAAQTDDEQQIASTIDRLEQTGDRAKQACQRAGDAASLQLQSAVMETHDQISSLKRQMH